MIDTGLTEGKLGHLYKLSQLVVASSKNNEAEPVLEYEAVIQLVSSAERHCFSHSIRELSSAERYQLSATVLATALESLFLSTRNNPRA